MVSDLELLALEIETQWELDERGRLVGTREVDSRPAPHMVVAVSEDGHLVAFGSEVPDGLVRELEGSVGEGKPLLVEASAAVGERGMQYAPTIEPPAAIVRCAELIAGVLGPVEISSGPSYVIPAGVHPSPDPSPPPADWKPDGDPERRGSSGVRIVRLGDQGSLPSPSPSPWHGEGRLDLRERNPRRGGWSAEEWDLLIDGELGPWVMAVGDGQVVSICHCARLSERGAEAGVWTDADYRGRGYAAAVTAAWASLLEGSGRTLFYSTSAENVSSQRVAGRLGLRGIGWTWRLSRRTKLKRSAGNSYARNGWD